MREKWNLTPKTLIISTLAVCFVLLVQGALPFLLTPTLGQAVWSMGFAQSFANQGIFDIYAHDFGAPKPAAIAFGLAGVWPASVLIRLGLHPADAYSAMVAGWMCLALFCAYKLSRQFGASRPISLLGAVLWMTMPISWAHSSYSMLSIGIALLSFYFLATARLLMLGTAGQQVSMASVALYLSAVVVAVFMDGYTFMMFAVGSSILLAYSWFARVEIRGALLRGALPVHVVCYLLAYLLYSRYIGHSGYISEPIDFFRGWGLDLTFMLAPTKGVLWLSDWLGISLARSEARYFGDASVWMTTFFLPTLVAGLFAWWRTRKASYVVTGFLLVAIFAVYMSLGPSLKVNSTKPEALQATQPREQSVLMAAEYAVFPTGNAWVSERLPGFNVMRASYRWSGLGIFALWLLVILGVAGSDTHQRRIWMLGLVVLIVFNLPNLHERWKVGVAYREMFLQIDQDLVAGLGMYLNSGDKVAFAPWGNDFMANYLAPKVGFVTFNVGGDKNLVAAQGSWPSAVRDLADEVDSVKGQAVVNMLLDGSLDALVLPYFDMLWSAHSWPCAVFGEKYESKDTSARQRAGCLVGRRSELKGTVEDFSAVPHLLVADTPFFAVVRLRKEFSGADGRSLLIGSNMQRMSYPLSFGVGMAGAPFVLVKGWHALEAHHVWSQSGAVLRLPVPEQCGEIDCRAVLSFSVYGANRDRQVSVSFDAAGDGWSRSVVVGTSDLMDVEVPLSSKNGKWQEVSIHVPEAVSPAKLTGSPDGRVLGIALRRIDLLGGQSLNQRSAEGSSDKEKPREAELTGRQ